MVATFLARKLASSIYQWTPSSCRLLFLHCLNQSMVYETHLNIHPGHWLGLLVLDYRVVSSLEYSRSGIASRISMNERQIRANVVTTSGQGSVLTWMTLTLVLHTSLTESKAPSSHSYIVTEQQGHATGDCLLL